MGVLDVSFWDSEGILDQTGFDLCTWEVYFAGFFEQLAHTRTLHSDENWTLIIVLPKNRAFKNLSPHIFPNRKGRNSRPQSPHKVPVFPASAQGPTPSGKPMTSALEVLGHQGG